MQKLADDAVAAGKLIREGIAKGDGFIAFTEKSSLHPKTVTAVERDGSQNGKDSGVPAAVVAAAFRLQKNGVSDIIEDGSSFYIITVQEIAPSRQLELAEVTEKIAPLLKSEKANRSAIESATKSLLQVRSAMKSGKSFADAVKAEGLKIEPLNGITPADSKNSAEQQALAAATLSLQDGELGQLQPAPWGAFAIHLEKRAPLTDAQWKEHQLELSKKLLSNVQSLIFREWLTQTRGAAQIKMLGKQRSGGA